jgi:MoaA/NifB/PqqE/SkfB family radical SAM enzyme
MDMQPVANDPPYLRNVGLLLTYHCQASCAHCILRAGPERHEEVNLEEAREWIRQVAAYRDGYVRVLSLTGGEPFSNQKLLRTIVEYATGLGLRISVTSNAFWATTDEKALRTLRSLPGISFLSVSTDTYHQEYVPFENVRNALRAAAELGIPAYVTVITDNRSDPAFQRVQAELLQLTAPDNVRTGLTFPVGRAADMKQCLHHVRSAEPCPEVCQAASSPCIFPDGRVYGCIGPLFELGEDQPLFLGNVRDHSVAEIFDRSETNAVLHALRLWGPARLIEQMRMTGLGKHLPRSFVADSVCSACHSTLSNSAVREWLQELEEDTQFRRLVAYGRLHYLGETGMLELSASCAAH